jgi:stage II sporulation protein M
MASLIGLFFGVVFGIIPLYLAVLNGYVVGFVSKIAIQQAGISSLWRLFPHGVFELPAIIISLALGLKLGFFLFSKNPNKEFIKRLILSLKTVFFIILPLLVIAALIEGSLITLLNKVV